MSFNMNFNMDDLKNKALGLADSAKKLAKEAAAQTGDLVNSSKIKLEMARLESDINSVKQQLGDVIYKGCSTRKGAPCLDNELLEHLVCELDTKYDQLDELKKSYASVKKTVVCEACGAANSKESFFCGRCGAPLPVVEAEEEAYDIAAEEAAEEETCEPCTQEEVSETQPVEEEAEPESCVCDEDVAKMAEADGADAETTAEVAKDAAEEE